MRASERHPRDTRLPARAQAARPDSCVRTICLRLRLRRVRSASGACLSSRQASGWRRARRRSARRHPTFAYNAREKGCAARLARLRCGRSERRVGTSLESANLPHWSPLGSAEESARSSDDLAGRGVDALAVDEAGRRVGAVRPAEEQDVRLGPATRRQTISRAGRGGGWGAWGGTGRGAGVPLG